MRRDIDRALRKRIHAQPGREHFPQIFRAGKSMAFQINGHVCQIRSDSLRGELRISERWRRFAVSYEPAIVEFDQQVVLGCECAVCRGERVTQRQVEIADNEAHAVCLPRRRAKSNACA